MNFGDAYEQHVDDVYAYLAYRSRSARVAGELTRETFERARGGWTAFDPARGSVRVWLLAIARTAYIDSRRRGMRGPRIAGEEGEDAGGMKIGSAAKGPDPEIAIALRRLERREREAIALRFGGELRSAEIAELLGISVANAQQILSRALRRLGAILER